MLLAAADFGTLTFLMLPVVFPPYADIDADLGLCLVAAYAASDFYICSSLASISAFSCSAAAFFF